jgi:hypothetical protein
MPASSSPVSYSIRFMVSAVTDLVVVHVLPQARSQTTQTISALDIATLIIASIVASMT